MQPSDATALAVRSWWGRSMQRLAGTVGAFGLTGLLVVGSCEPPPPPPPHPSGIVLDAKPGEAPCSYSDTFGAPRSGGRVHLGVDIRATEGNDLYAVVSGTVTKIYTEATDALAGNGLRITQPDGTFFFYAHLLSLAPGVKQGTQLTAGQLVGHVGQTGNAGGPHLHLEIHPQGGAAINPYPIVRHYGAC